ncbi:hypothetical protein AN958_08476, partial [Leucoagaricus sp. SymC.cos]
LCQRRIRHINCIQVCNFTPFPVRDHVTTALTQPLEPSQLTSLSHLSDDLDVSSRRRTRKLSSTSTNTKSSGRLEEEDTSSLLEPRGRKISHPRRSMNFGTDNSPPSVSLVPYGSPQALRRRGRTNSTASSISGQVKTSSLIQGVTVPVQGSSFSMLLPDISQQGLEKVIDSRLIETFLTILALSTIAHNNPPLMKASPSTHSASSNRVFASTRRTQTTSVSSLPSNTYKDKANHGMVRSPPPKLTASHPRLFSSSIYHQDGSEAQPSPSRLNGTSFLVPDFFSQIHRPSVNPTFPIDARPGRDFSSDSHTSGDWLKVQLWGRTKGSFAKAAGKQRQKSTRELVADTDSDWTVMEEWEFSLSDLLPLSEQVLSHTSDLPSNTLLVTLNPPGKIYYLPPSQTSLLRPPSPAVGYSSVKREDRASESTISSPVQPSLGSELTAHVWFHKSNDGTATPSKGPVRTATYQQLFELVNLQALIVDHENTLSNLVQRIDKHLEDDHVFPLRREISERHHRVGMLQNDFKMVVEETATRKKSLEIRRLRLEERKQSLVSARILEETNISDASDLVQEANEARDQLKELHNKFSPLRVGLLSTLASIYPIELESPPDLLYTILDVPFPIPLTATDPAPPLSLPSHRSVNEDAVATALGYVAQLLHLLAVYLGKTLIYPVTCVGSRSFIKDGISAMVGPRVFPLFSKGVDTYRFEYGVFLLNKNIEMLMLDRDLRALDMRHTLPNLKNLVLTVTHGEFVPVNRKAPPDEPTLLMLGLDSPTQQEPSTDIGSVTPKATVKKLDLDAPQDDGGTPPASGSTTPTTAALDEKKSRPFLGLSFPDFLRGRYPSTSRASVKSVPGSSEGIQSQAHVSGSNESGEPDAPEAHGDQGESDVKPSSEDLEVPNRRPYSEDGSEQAIEHKLETTPESETASIHVH